MEETFILRREPLLAQHQETPSSLINHLYIGHFLARWGARMWEFSVGLYMINIWPDSLLYAAIYGAVESASIALFGSIIGRWVDKLCYVKVLQLWLVTQNLSFVVAGATVVALLLNSSLKLTNFSAFILMVLTINICGGIGVLSTLAGTILIERELLVISEGQPPEFLTKMNSVTRRIDLTCKLLAPVVTGFIISFVSLKASAITLALWNTVSVWVEYWLFTSVYKGIPALGQSSQRRMARLLESDQERSNPTLEGDRLLPVTDGSSELVDRKCSKKLYEKISEIPYIAAWRVYLQQEVVLPGLALALLFFTVLSFGTLMTATLEWEGIPAYVIGLARGISALIGIAATIVYPLLQSHISSIRTGLWSIWSQDLVPESDRLIVGGVQNSLQSLMDLLAYVMGIILSDPGLHSSTASMYTVCENTSFTSIVVTDEIPITCLSFGTLMTATLKWEGIPAYVIGIARGISVVIGIAATAVYPVLQSHISTIRTGLWSIWSQDLVSESDRLIVGGVQSSLQSLMGLLAYVMGIIISDPRDFWKLTSISSSSHISCIPLLYPRIPCTKAPLPLRPSIVG
ncbi:Solute carrier family 40 member 2 [Glycine max]|nr:Solute carrier family 40 member 2 [Glycine max]